MGGAFGGAATCSYTMIHPQLVATFNQCTGPFVGDFRLGDDATDGPFQDVEVDSETCMWHPELPVAVCALAEPVTSFPIPPIMMGCETGLLEEGLEVAMVGFGDESNPPTKDETLEKRWGFNTLTNAGLELATFSPAGPTACDEGDLGSPLYAQYPDGTWHLLGISQESNDCANNNVYVRLHRVVPWIEETFGVDVTPCHDADGNWAPSSDCGAFPLEGPTGTGNWENWCEGAPTGQQSTTCGPAWDADPDEAMPNVWLESDPDPAELSSGALVSLSALVNHAVTEVFLEIDGNRIEPADATWPYAFGAVEFPDGEYAVRAIAVGADDVERASEVLTVRVGDLPTEGESTTTTGPADDESSGGSSAETTHGGDPGTSGVATSAGDGSTGDSQASSDGEASGCSVATRDRGTSQLWLLALLLLGGRTRSTATRIGTESSS